MNAEEERGGSVVSPLSPCSGPSLALAVAPLEGKGLIIIEPLSVFALHQLWASSGVAISSLIPH